MHQKPSGFEENTVIILDMFVCITSLMDCILFKDADRRTPLHAAAHCDEEECLRLLIMNGMLVQCHL